MTTKEDARGKAARLMAQSQPSKQDALMLEEIVRILQRRRDQYSSAFVQGLYIRGEDGTWRNGATKVTALQERSEAPVEPLDYGNVVYHEATISVVDMQELVETLAYEGVLKLKTYVVPMTKPEDIGRSIGFRQKEFITASHRWLKSEWPTNFFVYEGTLERKAFPYDRLVALDKPLYPDAHHLVAHKFGIDLQTSNAFINAILLFLPNYQAKLATIRVSADSLALEVLLGTAKLEDVSGKVFARNDVQTVHKDVKFRSDKETFPIGFSPTEMEVCLLNTNDGELLDQVWLRPGDVSAYAVIEETDPRVIELWVQQGEGEQVEFKPGKLEAKDREELAETAVAFANRDGGRILVGVADDGRVFGCFEDDVSNRITKLLVDRCDPPVNVRINRLLVDDKPVYLVVVQKSANKPHAVKGRGFFIRHGSNDYPLGRAELDEIVTNQKQPSLSRRPF